MILKVDEVTLSVITEETTEEKSIEYLLRHGPPIIVLMRGELGSSIFTRHGREDIPYIVPKDIIDTAGFDNVYMIGFLTEFIRTGGDIERSGYFAATCASLSAESAGPFQKISSRQVEKRLKTVY
jgi:sugar/nucleoside kinase (ribokinase family)